MGSREVPVKKCDLCGGHENVQKVDNFDEPAMEDWHQCADCTQMLEESEEEDYDEDYYDDEDLW